MTKGWRTGRLIDVATVSTGPFGSLLHKSDYVSDGVPLVNPINIVGELIIPDPGKLIDQATAHRLASYILRQGDIVVSRRGELGRCAAIGSGESGWVCGTGCFFIRPSSDIEPRFLAAMLRSDRYRSALEAASTGATMPSISNTTLSELLISIPERHAQQRIVAILDEAFAGIATAKANAAKNLQNARAIFSSHLKSWFTQQAGWTTKTLDQISLNLDSKRIPITKGDRKSGEFPYYGASGIVDYVADYIFDEDTLLVSEDGANLLARSTPIAFPASGKYWVNNHAHILKFENMATQRFVEFYLASIPLDDYITGAAQPKLNQKALNSIPIPIPSSLEGQEEVVASIESVQIETQRLESLYTRKLATLDELKQSLLQQAFSGQLTRIHA